MAVKWVYKTARGTGSGSSAANAAEWTTSLNAMIAAAAVGTPAPDGIVGEVCFLKLETDDANDIYTAPSSASITLTSGGTANTARVWIHGANPDGSPTRVTIRGARIWPIDGTKFDSNSPSNNAYIGNTLFAWNDGHSHVMYSHFGFEDVRTPWLVSSSNVTTLDDITLEKFMMKNISRGVYCQKPVTNLVMRNFDAFAFSKAVLRLNGDCAKVTVEDFMMDALYAQGDNWSTGVVVAGTTGHGNHDILIQRGTIRNIADKIGTGSNPRGSSDYWNGDCISTETADYDIKLLDLKLENSEDGGLDLKSYNTLAQNIKIRGCKRNVRIWNAGQKYVNIQSYAPRTRGGTGGPCHIYIEERVDDNNQMPVWIGGILDSEGTTPPFVENDTVLPFDITGKVTVRAGLNQQGDIGIVRYSSDVDRQIVYGGTALPMDNLSTGLHGQIGLYRMKGSYINSDGTPKPLITVRRDGPNPTTADIPYVVATGDLDLDGVNGLMTFATNNNTETGNTVTIVQWYNQVTGQGHFTSLSSADEMVIVDAGTLVQKVQNGKTTVAAKIPDLSTGYTATMASTYSGTAYSGVLVGSCTNVASGADNGLSNYPRFLSLSSSTNTDYSAAAKAVLIARKGGTTSAEVWAGLRFNAELSNGAATYNALQSVVSIFDGTSQQIFVDGVGGTLNSTSQATGQFSVNLMFLCLRSSTARVGNTNALFSEATFASGPLSPEDITTLKEIHVNRYGTAA